TALYAFQVQPGALEQTSRITFATCTGVLVTAWLTGATSREALAYALVAIVLLSFARSVAYLYERRRAIARPRRVLLVGTGPLGQELADRLLRHPEHGMRPIGFVDSSPHPI